jgi:membrane protein YdbS with pleckstrin-like domain
MRILKVILFLIALAASILSKLFLVPYQIIMYTVNGLFWGIFLVGSIFVIPLYYSKTCYYVSCEEIVKQSGFVVSSRQLMRVSAVQYITELTFPLSQYTGTNFLILNALGGKMALLYLSKKDADEITALLSASIRKKAD